MLLVWELACAVAAAFGVDGKLLKDRALIELGSTCMHSGASLRAHTAAERS